MNPNTTSRYRICLYVHAIIKDGVSNPRQLASVEISIRHNPKDAELLIDQLNNGTYTYQHLVDNVAVNLKELYYDHDAMIVITYVKEIIN